MNVPLDETIIDDAADFLTLRRKRDIEGAMRTAD
jgi:hypothetical protein